uniref:Uncharacterized protein n=1 Tax=Branchiostoma floridae TaxID=7739 RepID=C3ZQ94_BRAFL|eukprot:XP_002589276.1 hypothetical protein BRAFLDRAFT_102518 [Branchiostoma floridae]
MAPVWFLLVSSLILAFSSPLQCPDSCHMTDKYGTVWDKRNGLFCTCPRVDITNGPPCSWVGYRVPYTFSPCLDAIPTDFRAETRSIIIRHLRESTLAVRSFPTVPNLQLLKIEKSNVSHIQPGAFQGLPFLERLYLNTNRISSLEDDAFLGLTKLDYLYLERNRISAISQHAFRGLPSLGSLRMSQNYLSSLPVDALLEIKKLMIANLHTNLITNIDSQAMRLNQNQRLFLMIGLNKLRCDEKLTWFICHLPLLTFIGFRKALKCASPASLRDTHLINMADDVCHTDTDGLQQMLASSDLYNDTIPTEEMPRTNVPTRCETISTQNYTDIHTNNIQVSEQTTVEVDIIIPIGGIDLVTANDEEWISRFAILTVAFAVPFLVMLASLAVVFIHNRGQRARLAHPNVAPPGPNSDDSGQGQGIQPYAVVYDYEDLDEPQATDRNSASNRPSTPSHHLAPEDDTIQPYAVTYAEVPGRGKNEKHQSSVRTNDEGTEVGLQQFAQNGASRRGDGHKLQSYAMTRFDDQGQEDGYKILPYAIGYPDSSEVASADTDHPPRTNVANQQEAIVEKPVTSRNSMSATTAVDVHPKFENTEAGNVHPTTGNDVPNASRMLYRLQNAGAENEGSSDAMYNRTDGQPTGSSNTLYNPVDGQSDCRTSGRPVLYEEQSND